jgi:hypothetical protein
MDNKVLTLQFKTDCSDKGYSKGDCIEMSVIEYKALSEHKHPKTGRPMDPRINHTRVVEGAEHLEEKQTVKKKTVKKTAKKK